MQRTAAHAERQMLWDFLVEIGTITPLKEKAT
jgi:hypothetical protein